MTSLALLHVARRDLAIGEDDWRDLLERATGVRSLRAMDARQLGLVEAEVKRLGFKPSVKARHKAAPRADLRLVHVLWRRLGEARLVDKPGRAGLNAFVRARFGKAWGAEPADIDMVREHAQIEAVIRALTEIGKRGGLDLSKPEAGR